MIDLSPDTSASQLRRADPRPGSGAERLNRGDVYDVEWSGAGLHPVVIATRDVAIPVLRSVVVVLVTSSIRGIPSEVPLGPEHGVVGECVASCDSLLTVSKDALRQRRGHLGPADLIRLNAALRTALELER